ncbi:hypothetical protein GF327_00960 [Candidatus Woesearchaeota archaeon]|nr:hypothetical protein [Candidatus Woesearchaeota archaeon]
MLFKKKKKKIDKKTKIRNTADNEIKKIRDLLGKKETSEVSHEFFKLVRKIFSKLFNIRYEFTFQELRKDIKRKHIPKELKNKVRNFCDEIIRLEYSHVSITKNQLSTLIDEFENIVNFEKKKKKIEKQHLVFKNIKEAGKKLKKILPDKKYLLNIPEKLHLSHQDTASHNPIESLPPAFEPISSEKNDMFLEHDEETPILPKFDTSFKNTQNQDKNETQLKVDNKKLRQQADDILKKINSDKDYITKEVEKISTQEKNLTKQKSELKQIFSDLKKDQRQEEQKKIQELKTNLGSRQEELNRKEKSLLEKKQQIEKKIKKVESIRNEIYSMSKKVSDDEVQVKVKEEELRQKEQVLEQIKKDIKSQKKKAEKEIDKFKKILKQKQEKFLQLQKYFNSRENRLSVKETNFLKAKKEHVRFLENHIQKHKHLIEKDLENTINNIQKHKSRINHLETVIRDFKNRKKQISDFANHLKKESNLKEKHFLRIENEFKKQKPKLIKSEKLMIKREKYLLKREKEINKYESKINQLKNILKDKQHKTESRELDLKTQANKLKNKKIKYEAWEKGLDKTEKRVLVHKNKYEQLKKDIDKQIKKRKRRLNKRKNKLKNREKYLKSRQRKAKKLYQGVKKLGKDIYGLDYNLQDDEELHIHEITISTELPDMKVDLSSPHLLEIYRLLNIAKIAMDKGEFDDAKRIYLKINEIYASLSPEEQTEAHDIVLSVYKPKKGGNVFKVSKGTNKLPDDTKLNNISFLITKFHEKVHNHQISESRKIYNEIKRTYRRIPDSEKSKYYDQIMSLYNQALRNFHIS